MLLFICAQLFAAESSKEIMIGSVNQESSATSELGADILTSFELSGAYGVSEKLSVIASYGYGGIETSYETPYRESAEDYDSYYYGDGRAFQSAFVQHQLSVGARYRHTFNDWASVYGKAEGNVALHTVDFAPSIRDEDPISKVSTMGVSFGGTAALGVMGSFQINEKIPDIFISLEGGYNFLTAASFDSIGDLDLSGGYSSLGFGLRF